MADFYATPEAASRQQVLQRRRRRRHGGIHQPARGWAGRAERAARPWRQCRQRAAQSSRSRRCRRRCRRRSRCRGCEPMTPRRGGSTTTGIRCQPGTYYTAASPGHITFIHISPPIHIILHPGRWRGDRPSGPIRNLADEGTMERRARRPGVLACREPRRGSRVVCVL